MEQKTPFNEPQLRNWMMEALGRPPSFPANVATVGFGPFHERDFDEFLSDLKVNVYQADPETAVLIVGRHGWNVDQLEEMVADRQGQVLKVYSQEMVLTFLFAGLDPFDAGEDTLHKLAEGHPALEHLSAIGFDWPSTKIAGGGGGLDEADWPRKGILSHMGYRAGKTANLSLVTRQRILRRIVEEDALPQINNAAYMSQWGAGGSKKRLMKLSNTLASLCRTEKSRTPPPWEAIQQRETDLVWLKTTFYDGRFSFVWPSTQP